MKNKQQIFILLSFMVVVFLIVLVPAQQGDVLANNPRRYSPSEVHGLIEEAKKGDETAVKKLMAHLALQLDYSERLTEFTKIAHDVKDFSIEFALFQDLLWKNNCKTDKLVTHYSRTLELFDDNEVMVIEYKKSRRKAIADAPVCSNSVAVKIDEIIDQVAAP